MPRRPFQIHTGASYATIQEAQVRPSPNTSSVPDSPTTIIQELVAPSRPNNVSKPTPRPPFIRQSRPSPTPANAKLPPSETLTKYIRPIGSIIAGGMMITGGATINGILGGLVILNGAADIGMKTFGAKEGDVLASLVYDNTDPVERLVSTGLGISKQQSDIFGAILFFGAAGGGYDPKNRIPALGAGIICIGEIVSALEPEFNSPK